MRFLLTTIIPDNQPRGYVQPSSRDEPALLREENAPTIYKTRTLRASGASHLAL
jgi:hypothetical protein